MLELENRLYWLKTKEVWFSDRPFDIPGYHRVIFQATKSKVDLAGFQVSPSTTTLVIDLTQELDTIWKKMSRQRARKGIKRAQREGVSVKLNENYDEFQDLNDSFRKQKGLAPTLISTSTLKRGGPLFIAEYDGEILCGHAYFADDSTIRAKLQASKRLADTERATFIGNANRLLIWEAIQYAKGRGLQEFDFGGYYAGDGGSTRKGYSHFKEGFGGDAVERYHYWKNYSKLHLGIYFGAQKLDNAYKSLLRRS
jgi:CelD/BcsL family acetyltransferase involved in cellulose biosynthesis